MGEGGVRSDVVGGRGREERGIMGRGVMEGGRAMELVFGSPLSSLDKGHNQTRSAVWSCHF